MKGAQGGVDAGWATWEFERIELNDGRLERRLWRIAEDLSRQPEYPINQASEDAAATKAAYRFFDNEKGTAAKIFSTHRERTVQRMRDEPVVLAIQDTTFLNFTGHRKTRGLGPIGDSKRNAQGLIVHSCLAVTPYGLPLGVISHACWARTGYRESDNAQEEIPIEEKESYRWIETLRETTKLSVSHASSMVVTVADRESDIYEFLLEAQAMNAKYVIRACHDRHVHHAEYDRLQEYLRSVEAAGAVAIDVPTQNRRASLELRFVPVTLRPPERMTRSKTKLHGPCWVIHVGETVAPAGSDPLTWTLLTNIPVTSLEQAIERLGWYRRRWSIEEYHKILKSGCTVEDCRLQTAERLTKYIALISVIGWRIFWMVHVSRADPSAPAEIALTKIEIRTLCSLQRFKSKLPPEKSLTIKQAIIAVACLGGYRNRKNDRPPGATVLWRGWQRLSSMSELYESMADRCG
jgi:hypothetical protein